VESGATETEVGQEVVAVTRGGGEGEGTGVEPFQISHICRSTQCLYKRLEWVEDVVSDKEVARLSILLTS
jgi:hypothetical protein